MDTLRRSLRSKAPGVADALSEEVREEVDEQQRRMRGRKRRAQDAPKSLFSQGIPLLEEETEDDVAPQYRAAPGSPFAIEPLPEKVVKSDLFGDKPGMNEALTVAKVTWKIFRSGKL